MEDPAPLPQRTRRRGNRQQVQPQPQTQTQTQTQRRTDDTRTSYEEGSDVSTTVGGAGEVQKFPYIVIGGGIAGVSCAKELTRLVDPQNTILLISATKMIKETKSVLKMTEILEDLMVYEKKADCFQLDNPQIEIIERTVIDIDTESNCLLLDNYQKLYYEKLCICSGAKPRCIYDHPDFITIRDTDSIVELASRISSGGRIAIVGNGGIALELIYLLDFCDVTWIIKDHNYVGSTFFDATASSFIMPQLEARLNARELHQYHPQQHEPPVEVKIKNRPKRTRQQEDKFLSSLTPGSALGPEWASKTELTKMISSEVIEKKGSLKIHYGQSFIDIHVQDGEGGRCKRVYLRDQGTYMDEEHVFVGDTKMETTTHDDECRIHLHLSDGSVVSCDTVVCAIGVEPNLDFISNEKREGGGMKKGKNGALVVNERCETSAPKVWAAGDCSWIDRSCGGDEVDLSHNWLQMQLWSQAKSMGTLAAQCMVSCDDIEACELFAGVHFELFAHTTHFFGYKVVLLGRFNGQGIMKPDLEASVKSIAIDRDTKISQKSDGSRSSGIDEPKKGKKSKDNMKKTLSCSSDPTLGAATGKNTSNVEIWTRITPKQEYIKLTVVSGRVVGALLIGDTDLEEMLENLILNKLDVSRLGIGLLDPDVDIEDYFD